MIREYHRPQSIPEALALLARQEIMTLPLGGGTVLNRVIEPIFGSAAQGKSPGGPGSAAELEEFAVVDIQDLGLGTIKERGNRLEIGAAVTLQLLLTHPGLPPALGQALRHEASYNLRHAATVAGTLVAADGRSPFTTALLALDSSLTLLPGETLIDLGDWLPFRQPFTRGRLIASITLPLNVRLAYEYVARTPADLPIVCAAVAQWPGGRTRAVLGGFGRTVALALDGPEPGGAETAARNVYSQAGDAWASAEYRQEMAGLLVRRGLEALRV